VTTIIDANLYIKYPMIQANWAARRVNRTVTETQLTGSTVGQFTSYTKINQSIAKKLQHITTKYKKPSCRWDSRLHWLSVTFKVIQNRWFSLHLKGHMPLPTSD